MTTKKLTQRTNNDTVIILVGVVELKVVFRSILSSVTAVWRRKRHCGARAWRRTTRGVDTPSEGAVSVKQGSWATLDKTALIISPISSPWAGAALATKSLSKTCRRRLGDKRPGPEWAKRGLPKPVKCAEEELLFDLKRSKKTRETHVTLGPAVLLDVLIKIWF